MPHFWMFFLQVPLNPVDLIEYLIIVLFNMTSITSAPRQSTICSPCLIRNVSSCFSSFTDCISDNISFRFCLQREILKNFENIFQNYLAR